MTFALKNLSCLLIAILTFQVAFSQNPRTERIKSLKIAFLTEKLELTTEEAKGFWPVYNTYEEEHQKLRRERNGLVFAGIKNGPLSQITDAEAQEALNEYLKLEQEKVDLDRKLFSSLKGVIPPSKIAYLKVMEEEFNRRLLEQLRASRKQR